MILTDGEARDRTKALVEAEKLRRKGVHIMAIGMGEQKTVATFRKDLKLMASSPADVYTADFKKLPYLVKALTSEICYGKPQKGMETCLQRLVTKRLYYDNQVFLHLGKRFLVYSLFHFAFCFSIFILYLVAVISDNMRKKY